jgi:hypothetical protein
MRAWAAEDNQKHDECEDEESAAMRRVVWR